MSPVHVLHVLDTAEPRGTAICGIVEDLATRVNPAQYQIHACFLRSGPLVERLRRAGVDCTSVDWSGSARDPRGAARYASALRSFEFGIVHQHTGGRLLTRMGRLLTHARIVRALHFRANEATGMVPSHLNLPESDVLIAVSRVVADFSRDPRAVVVYPGIDVSRFPQERRSHRGLVIGTACRLERVKGIGHLLEALASLTSQIPELRLEVAGDGNMRAALEEQACKLGISNRVSFLGWREDLPALMAGWDIFVLPSLDEGFPIAGLEAMAAGLPVVASAVGGIAELVEDGETGRLAPPAAPAKLAACLRELLSDRQKWEAMGEAGRQRAQRVFPVSRMVEQTVTIYDGLIAK